MWPKAHEESCNYTHREDMRGTAAGSTPSALSSKDTQRFPLSLLDENMFLAGHTFERWPNCLLWCKCICCLMLFFLTESVCVKRD